MIKRLLLLIASAVLLAPTLATAQSVDFPTRTVRLIVNFGGGSAPDVVVRVLAEELSKMWGQPVIVENKPGASGILAMQELKRAPADGHVYALGDVGILAINPHVFNSLPYDPEKDLRIVTDLLEVPYVLFVPRSSQIRSLEDLVHAATSKPGALTYGTSGKGSPSSMALNMVKQRLKLDMLEIPHRSGTDIFAAVATARIDLMAASLLSAESFKDRLFPIAIASDNRDLAPQIPSLSSASGVPGFEITAWSLIVTRKETPDAIVDKVRKDMEAAFAMPAVRERMVQFGTLGGGSKSPAELEAMVKKEMARYGEVVKAERIQKN